MIIIPIQFVAVVGTKGSGRLETSLENTGGLADDVADRLVRSGLAVLIWFAVVRLEGEGPSAALDAASPLFIGKSTELSLDLADPKSGCAVSGRTQQGRQRHPDRRRRLSRRRFSRVGKSRSARQALKIDRRPWGFPTARPAADHGRRWILAQLVARQPHRLQREIVIDTKPPVIENLSQQNYVNKGGRRGGLSPLGALPYSAASRGQHVLPRQQRLLLPTRPSHRLLRLSHQQGAGTEIAARGDRRGRKQPPAPRYPYHFRKSV